MNEHSFLEAIRNRPNALAERLVYADWLTDRGDPRGEFIHLQCRAHKLFSAHPRRLSLESEYNELLFRHEEEWLAPLIGHIGNWEWKNGLLDSVSVDTEVFLANAERWLPSLPLLGLHLRRVGGHTTALAKCRLLAHVTGLYLGDNALTDEQLKTLLRSRHLRRVRTLFLHNNRLTDESANLLANTEALPRLRDLSLSRCGLTDEGIAALAQARGLLRLRRLTLMLTRCSESSLKDLFASQLMSRLRELDLGMNVFGPGPLADLAKSPGLANLHTLLYAMNNPGNGDVVALSESPHTTNLRVLYLGGYRAFGDQALQALANSAHFPRLAILELGSGTWTPTGMRALCRSRAFKGLRTLHITQGNETARGIARAIFGGPMIRQLRDLELEISKVGPGAIQSLSSHPKPLPLWRLRLPLGRNVGDAWKLVLEKGSLNNLTDLTLEDVPPGGLRAMCEPGRFPQLRQLRLYVIPRDIEEFQALLDSPLWRQLTSFRLNVGYRGESKFADEVIPRLTKAWELSKLNSLGLLWSLSAKQVRMLSKAAPPPRLMNLELGSFRMGVEGATALANWPGLRHLRHLRLVNSSSQEVPGLGALAESPHSGNLLRLDITNGSFVSTDVPALRQRFGTRVATAGRYLPRTLVVGGRRELRGDGLD